MILTGTGIIAKVKPLFLDKYPNAAQAYSLQALNNNYAGNCIRVRRSLDNALQDIGFVNNSLDTNALLNFVGPTGNGFIDTLYDQSGNGGNATQSNTSFQPSIVLSGVLQTSNGKPTINYGGGGDRFYLNPPNVLSNATTFSLFGVWTIFDGSSGGIYGPTTGIRIGLEILQENIPANKPTYLRINATDRAVGTTPSTRLWNSGVQTITSIFGNPESVSAFKNNTQVTLQNSSPMPALDNTGSYSIGVYNVSRPFSGNIQELVIWTSNQANNNTVITEDINSYYGTF